MRNDFVSSLNVRKYADRTSDIYPTEGQKKPHRKTLISAEQISDKVQEMAIQIAKDYKGKPLGLICVEYGAREFYNLLVDNLHCLGMTNFYQGAVKVERGATKTTEDREQAKFHFEAGIACDKNKLSKLHILIVDDQISTGKTFDLLKERYFNAISVELATLIVKSKAQDRLSDIKYYSFFIKSRHR